MTDPRLDALDTLFEGPDWASEPGCAALLMQDGQPVWTGLFGQAHVVARRPVEATTRFRIASITKPMFALVMAGLEQEGRLSLDDPLSQWLPEISLPKMPTLGQMLSMKSGVLESYPVTWFALGGGVDHAFSLDQTLALMLAQSGQNFAPGERTLYCNTNYVLAQLVAERASGEACGALLQRFVFEPAGMTRTVLADGPTAGLSGMALAYAKSDVGFASVDPPASFGASGAVVSTLDDMGRFYGWLRANPYGWREHLAGEVLHNDASASAYSHGFFRQLLSGRRVLGHSGGIASWSCDSLWSPETDTVAIVLGARTDHNWYERVREMLVTWWGARPDPAMTPRLFSPVAPKPVWTADYANEHDGFVVTLQGTEGELNMEGRRLPACTDGRYRRSLGTEPITFTLPNGAAEAPHELVRQEGNFVHTLTRADPLTSPPLDGLVGVYSCPDLPSPLVISLDEEGRLRASVGAVWPPGDRLILRPVLRTLFRAHNYAGGAHELNVTFELGDNGEALAVTAHLLRIRALRFERTTEGPDLSWTLRYEAGPRFLPWRAE